MSIPDPYRQNPQPAGGYPAQPGAPQPSAGVGQPGGNYRAAGYPQAGYAGQAYPQQQPYGSIPGTPGYPVAGGYPQAGGVPVQPQYPQQGSYPQQAGYPQQPQYPQQPHYPQQSGYPAYPYGNQPQQPAAPYGQPYSAPVYPQAGQPQAYAPQAPIQPAPIQPAPAQPDYQQQAFQSPAIKPAGPSSQPTATQPTATPLKPIQPQKVAAATSAPAITPSRPVPIVNKGNSATGASVAPSGTTTTAASAVSVAATTKSPTAATKSSRPVLVKKTDKDKMKVEDREPEEGEEKPPEVVRKAPPWLISLVFHMVLLIVLGLIYFNPFHTPVRQIEAVFAEKLGEQLEDSSVDISSPDPIDTLDTEWSKDQNLVEDPLAAPPTVELETLLPGTTATSDIAAPSIGMALTGREKGAKKALLAAYGGTRLTEESVRKGLEWLKRNQRADGSWSLEGPYTDGGNAANPASATAMALLAFQGAGNTHRQGDFQKEVVKGWKYLLAQQDADGFFVRDDPGNPRLYTQAQCMIAICELYGMTKDEAYRKPAQNSIKFALDAQAPEGGWRYHPKTDADLSVTGWFVMGLQSAMMAGLEVPSPELENINNFLDSVAYGNGAQYCYKPGRAPTLPMTAEGLLCRQYLGWKQNDERLKAGVAMLLQNRIDYSEQNVYYWYYATQVLHHMGHKDWDQWNAVMREAVPKAQVQTGKEAGSWSPNSDAWGNHGGRLYTTCLSIYMLEVYYRHLPIYKHKLL